MAMISPLIIAPHIFWKNDSVAFVERPFFTNLSSDLFCPIYLCNDCGIHSNYPNFGVVKEVKRNQLFNLAIRGLNHTMASEVFNCPDKEWYIWGKRAIKSASILIENNEVDYIHTCSNPASDHLIGLHLKQKYGLPWVAQFFDPWYGSPYRKYRNPTYSNLDKNWEYEVAHYADLIIHNNDAMRELWINRYGKMVEEKIVILPMAYDFREKQTNISSHKNIVISHIGNLYGERTAKSFIQAVDIFLKSYPEARERFTVNFVGFTQKADIQMIHEKELDDLFNITGRISAEECEYYYHNSDIFLCIDANDCENDYFFPSKLLNYFYYTKPILGITPFGSVMNHELSKSGHISIPNTDISSIVSYLHEVINLGSEMNSFSVDYWKKFTPKVVASQYEQCILKHLSFQ